MKKPKKVDDDAMPPGASFWLVMVKPGPDVSHTRIHLFEAERWFDVRAVSEVLLRREHGSEARIGVPSFTDHHPDVTERVQIRWTGHAFGRVSTLRREVRRVRADGTPLGRWRDTLRG